MEVYWGMLIFVPIIGIVIALVIAAEATYDDGHFGFTFVTILLILVVIGNIFGMNTKWPDTLHEDAYINSCDAAGVFGLKSNVTYPTQVGARIGGTTGGGYFWSGLFGGSGKVTMQPGSALSLGFDYQDKSAILEVPMSKITFIRDSSATNPSVLMRLKCEAKSYHAVAIVRYGPPRLVLDSLMLVNRRDEVGRETDTSAIMEGGLAPVIQDSLKTVEIRLTPELYAQILG